MNRYLIILTQFLFCFLLNGCNENNSVDPVKPDIFKVGSSSVYMTNVTTNSSGKASLDLSKFLGSVKISDISDMSKGCKFTNLIDDGKGFNFSYTNDELGACAFRYSLDNNSAHKDNIFIVTLGDSGSKVSYLPTVTYNVVSDKLEDSYKIDISDLLQDQYAESLDPDDIVEKIIPISAISTSDFDITTNEETVDDHDDVVLTAYDFGSYLSIYMIRNSSEADNTYKIGFLSTGLTYDDGHHNKAPVAKYYVYPENINTGDVVSINVDEVAYDPDGDVINFTSAISNSGFATLNADKTVLSFKPTKSGGADVTYSVTDHNGGVAHAVISFSVKGSDDIHSALYTSHYVDSEKRLYLGPVNARDDLETVKRLFPTSEGVYKLDEGQPKDTASILFTPANANKYCKELGYELTSHTQYVSLINTYDFKMDYSDDLHWPGSTRYVLSQGEDYLYANISDATDIGKMSEEMLLDYYTLSCSFTASSYQLGLLSSDGVLRVGDEDKALLFVTDVKGKPYYLEPEDYIFVSDDPTIVASDQLGNLHANRIGDVTITATNKFSKDQSKILIHVIKRDFQFSSPHVFETLGTHTTKDGVDNYDITQTKVRIEINDLEGNYAPINPQDYVLKDFSVVPKEGDTHAMTEAISLSIVGNSALLGFHPINDNSAFYTMSATVCSKSNISDCSTLTKNIYVLAKNKNLCLYFDNSFNADVFRKYRHDDVDKTIKTKYCAFFDKTVLFSIPDLRSEFNIDYRADSSYFGSAAADLYNSSTDKSGNTYRVKNVKTALNTAIISDGFVPAFCNYIYGSRQFVNYVNGSGSTFGGNFNRNIIWSDISVDGKVHLAAFNPLSIAGEEYSGSTKYSLYDVNTKQLSDPEWQYDWLDTSWSIPQCVVPAHISYIDYKP
ncbi:Ig-like domain-containing protein [Photobacterium damselae]|uniref:Uncharacterized protein n=1 Tax=Photobacterium damselae TaxID=38293 RepID=A0ABD6X7J0_PHODM|nr:hypothetical protein [Photobacterium damselae]OBU43832.1 hypothetical protein AYY27_04360 [Photobacterium damselae]PSU18722.1 hypothetical protein CTM90_01695 [Photobacterium damselae]